MELLLMLLVPLPVGYLVKNKTVGYLVYVAVHGFAFTFQTLYLILGWASGESSAFGTFPETEGSETLAYGLVNAVIFAVGIGLVALGQRLAARRAARADMALSA